MFSTGLKIGIWWLHLKWICNLMIYPTFIHSKKKVVVLCKMWMKHIAMIGKSHKCLFYSHSKIENICSNTSQESKHVYDCVASLLLTGVYKCLGTEDSSCRILGTGMLSHSCLIQVSSAQQSGHLYFSFHDALKVFSWWKLWTAGQFSTLAPLLWIHTVVIYAI